MGFPEQPHDQGQQAGGRSGQQAGGWSDPGDPGAGDAGESRSEASQPWAGQSEPGPPGPSYPGAGQPGLGQAPGGYYPPGFRPRSPAGTGRTNGLAIAALVCGLAQFLLWFFLLVPGFIAAILALIFGLVGLGQTRLRGEGGRGMAIAGIVLGSLGVLSGIVWGILLGIGSTNFHYHTGT